MSLKLDRSGRLPTSDRRRQSVISILQLFITVSLLLFALMNDCSVCVCCYQIANLGTIGGTSVKECTRRILLSLLSDSCARQLNWRGRGDKIAFASMNLNGVINSK